jgi:hypothetical protein
MAGKSKQQPEKRKREDESDLFRSQGTLETGADVLPVP